MRPAHPKLQAARLKIIRKYPYLASALVRMPMIENTECLVNGQPTMGVDKNWRCHYHPAFVQKLDIDTLSTFILHELYHLLREHHARRHHRDTTIWNIATDLEINDDLVRAGHPFGELSVALPEKFGLPANLLAEQYYEALVQGQGQSGAYRLGGSPINGDPSNSHAPSTHAPSCNGSHGPKRSQHGAPSGQSPQDGANPDLTRSTTTSHHATPPHQAGATPYGGSCSDGIQRKWEQLDNDSDTTAVSHAEAQILRKETARLIQEYQHMNGQGSVPAGLARWAHEQLEPPKVNWQHELQAQLQYAIAHQRGMLNYSYRYPNRRYRSQIILPSLMAPQPEIAVIIDTSESMSNDQLAQCLNELRGILKTTGYGATVLTADTRVNTVQRVWNDPKKVRLIGGGGTNMAKAIQFATNQLKPKPDIVVVLTDGLTPWPAEPPRKTKVIVALINGNIHRAPDWAQVVEVKQ